VSSSEKVGEIPKTGRREQAIMWVHGGFRNRRRPERETSGKTFLTVACAGAKFLKTAVRPFIRVAQESGGKPLLDQGRVSKEGNENLRKDNEGGQRTIPEGRRPLRRSCSRKSEEGELS